MQSVYGHSKSEPNQKVVLLIVFFQALAFILELALIAAVVALVARHEDPYSNYFRAHPVLMVISYVMMCQGATIYHFYYIFPQVRSHIRYFHGAIGISLLCFMYSAFGVVLGTKNTDKGGNFTVSHERVGLVVVIAVTAQVLSGIYKKYHIRAGRRRAWWHGRFGIALLMVATFAVALGVEKFLISTSYKYYEVPNEYAANTTSEYESKNSTQSEYGGEEYEYKDDKKKNESKSDSEYGEDKQTKNPESSSMIEDYPDAYLVTAYKNDPPLDSVSEGLAIFIYCDLALLTFFVQFFDVFFVYISSELG
eukprot:TRINITY_DN5550_c0_g1_i1.p1 TRINITY_DN5550_c0_g1~~TRINITY_DN5550_c0_g1_i1.p1  ORF type:complete len:308 (+),score=50.92 TRINITY_DN5550_c0_g1_i1:100-1023(+)